MMKLIFLLMFRQQLHLFSKRDGNSNRQSDPKRTVIIRALIYVNSIPLDAFNWLSTYF